MLNNLLVERSRKLVIILHRRKNKLRRSMALRLLFNSWRKLTLRISNSQKISIRRIKW